MIAFEVSVNGERLCVAGIGTDGVLNAIVNYAATSDADIPDPLRMTVGGLVNDEHLTWGRNNASALKVGDVVQIHIIETEDVDTPVEIYPSEAV